MLKCWQESPTQRPTFEELVKEFDAMLVSLSDKVDSTRQLEEVLVGLLVTKSAQIVRQRYLKPNFNRKVSCPQDKSYLHSYHRFMRLIVHL